MNRLTRLTLLALALLAAPAARAQQAVNPIHPVFAPLDAAGKKVKAGADVSLDRTCGACHDVAYIASHSGHARPKSTATCAQCHVDGGTLDVRPETLDGEGRLLRQAIRIGAPRAASCAACHGLLGGAHDPVALPADFEATAAPGGRTWSLTQGEGAVVSPQRMSDSFLNLEGKAGLSAPWDVHAAKLVDCIACHYAANNPARTESRQGALRYLTSDPRRLSTAEFLLRPDHHLAEQGCRSCHDPLKAHEFLPYRTRHMTVLSCQACHLASPAGPAVEMIDATVVTLAGTPAVRYRGLERRPGDTLNTATLRSFQPLLVERTEADGARRLAPVNTVSRFRWVAGADRAEVPAATVARAFLEGGAYAPAILEHFDADRDGRLDPQELRLDGTLKAELVAARLAAAGVDSPAIDGTLTVYPLAHGVSTRDRAQRDCQACHAEDSRLGGSFLVAGYLPGGAPPRPGDHPRVELAGTLTPGADGSLALLRGEGAAPSGLHVLGHSRQGATNTIGFGLFAAVFIGVATHGLLRLLTQGRRAGQEAHARAPTGKAYVFGRYERLWHWTMALSGVFLIWSGLEIHWAGAAWLLSLPGAISLHNVFAVVLMLNAFLALFYHLATKAIRNFIPAPQGLVGRILEHMTYQSRGIFFGGPHPNNAPGQKLNPLQQLTYLALLNVLFPLQIVTGLLIWAVGHWPNVAAAVGGLGTLAPLHNLGSWLFLTFFVLHVYLVTTGRTPTEHLESMITGYQPVEDDRAAPERS
ncbi:MAG: cytochrome b/b6 domain-containing protein [Anaeromyxobacter sp.]|nr:cytochrome b/b6 domain-containing protein [Anaeromyxobacter sp.]